MAEKEERGKGDDAREPHGTVYFNVYKARRKHDLRLEFYMKRVTLKALVKQTMHFLFRF